MTETALEEARRALSSYLIPTPLVRSNSLSEELGAEVLLKLENLQRTGSFKVRGALWKLLDLDPAERERGVVTASAGNHARGMVLACNLLGVPCRVYVPDTTTPEAAATLRKGEVTAVVKGHGYDQTEEIARAEAREHDVPFVSAFDDPRIIEGNGGTLGLEILDEAPDMDCLVAPVGGGGLLGGLGLALSERGSAASLFGAQSEASCAMARSLAEGRPILNLPFAETLATRLEGGIAERTFLLAKKFVREVAVVTEEDLARAVVRAALGLHLVVEPSGAAGLAALLARKIKGPFNKIVVVLSGGNIDREVLVELLGRAGRT